MQVLTNLGCVFLLAVGAAAQVVDDLDLRLGVSGQGVRGIQLAELDDGTVVAAWVRNPGPPNQSTPWDQLVVAVSTDNGRSWKTQYADLVGTNSFMMRVSLAVASGTDSPYDRWAFVALERLGFDRAGNATRWIEVVKGPLDKPWNYNSGFPQRSHVISDNPADPAYFFRASHLTSAMVPYTEGGKRLVMYVITYAWYGGGLEAVYAQAPFAGTLGPKNNTGRPEVLGGPGGLYSGARYGHPSIAADLQGRGMYVAFEDKTAGQVHVAWADPQVYRTGTPFSRQYTTSGGKRSAPYITVNNNTALMTCLGAPNTNVPGTSALEYYWNQRSAGWAYRGMLAAFAFSPAPIRAYEGTVYAVYHGVVDPNPERNVAQTIALHGRPRDATLTATTVGDRIVWGGTPTLALGAAGAERPMFAWGEGDDWLAQHLQPMFVDPGKR